jgi:hypothetical protein
MICLFCIKRAVPKLRTNYREDFDAQQIRSSQPFPT